MVELFFSIIFEFLFYTAIYVPGVCIRVLIGRSAKDLDEGETLALSFAFWGVVIMLCLIGWAGVSWLNVGAR